jgi:hypothetical protein
MRGIPGVPVVLEASDELLRLVLTRIPGAELARAGHPPDAVFIDLRRLIADMLSRGVARHAMPSRDVIVQPDGRAGLVDFERVTLRRWRHSPLWFIASTITRFHLRRLLWNHAPHLLTLRECRLLRRQQWVRDRFRSLIVWRRRLRRGRAVQGSSFLEGPSEPGLGAKDHPVKRLT